MYCCKKCLKVFNRKSTYTNHINRKTRCDKQLIVAGELRCPGCKKELKSSASLYYHVKNNLCKHPDCIQSNTITNNLNNIETFNINNNLNVDNVNVVKFGQENLSFMTDDLYKQILGRGFNSVMDFIAHSHFNKDHPENHNIYIANIRDDCIVLYDGDKWTINNRDELVEDIIYAKSDFLFSKFKELKHQMEQSEIDRFMRFMDQRDNSQTMNRLKNEIKLQLYNNRHGPQKLRRYMESRQRILDNKSIKESGKTFDSIINILGCMDSADLKHMEKILNSFHKK